MTKPRELKVGDQVKITGPWVVGGDYFSGGLLVGESATVIQPEFPDSLSPITIMTRDELKWHWCRKNLRALPRK